MSNQDRAARHRGSHPRWPHAASARSGGTRDVARDREHARRLALRTVAATAAGSVPEMIVGIPWRYRAATAYRPFASSHFARNVSTAPATIFGAERRWSRTSVVHVVVHSPRWLRTTVTGWRT